GLEGALNDVTAKRIIDEVITPKFRDGDFAGGISAGVGRIVGVIDGEPLPAPPPRPQRQGDNSDLTQFLNPFNPFTIIIVLVLGGVFRSVFGRLFGSIATGGLIGIVAWFIFGSLILSGIAGVIASIFTMFSDSITAATPRGRGGWSGGSSGSSWGGSSGGSSSSDSGGFSGGGGSFGGGGASGSW
ncbi:MAG TPA: TPM domain-containing protein, partial [Bradyrhizobium sp.]